MDAIFMAHTCNNFLTEAAVPTSICDPGRAAHSKAKRKSFTYQAGYYNVSRMLMAVQSFCIAASTQNWPIASQLL